MNKEMYDVIIIGGGPAGYSAALYTSRAGLRTLVIEKMYPGGQMSQTNVIDNYPGFEEGIDGITLGMKMKNQAHKYGASTLDDEVIKIEDNVENKVVITASMHLITRNIIIATGARHKHLEIVGEEEYIGRGIHYCATCDGAFYKDKTVVVVGGGNTAVADALFLSRLAKEVIVVHRRDEFRATKIYHKQLEDKKNVSLKLESEVKEIIIEDNKVKGVKIFNKNNSQEEIILCDGIFVGIGIRPNTDIFRDILQLDENGYIIAGEDTATSVEGIYAIGDVRTKDVRQVVTAVADGAIAAWQVEKLLSK